MVEKREQYYSILHADKFNKIAMNISLEKNYQYNNIYNNVTNYRKK